MLLIVAAWPTTVTFSSPWQVLQNMPGHAEIAVAARDGRLVRVHVHALQRPVAGGVAVHAAGMQQHLTRLLEERGGTGALVGDAGELGSGPERGGFLGLRAVRDGGGRREHDARGEPNDIAELHERAPHAVGSGRKGRLRTGSPVSARQALATAGPIGGTPGSPTPVGFSVERITSTTTSGISLMRIER